MFWINDIFSVECNSEIIEYDIKRGNYSISKEYNLLPQRFIEKLDKMEDKDRKVYCGVLQGKNKEYAKALEEHFEIAVNKFIEMNNLDKDNDIISIKRDAVFVINKTVKHEFISENVHFRPKNVYHAYIKLKRFEFYFGKDYIDIKGLKDEIAEKHSNGILSILFDLVEVMEKSNMNYQRINRYLADIVKKYKNRTLPIECYRSFDEDSSFTVNLGGETIKMDEIDEYYLEFLDIYYNYLNVILPLIKLFI